MNSQASILVVDDNPINFDVIEALLTPEDYQLHYISSGIQVFEQLDHLQPDVILLDIMMPDLDGIEVCRRIRALPDWQYVPILMVTALSATTDLARAIAAGADDFISKPVNNLELRARVHSMLRIKRQYDRLEDNLQRQRQTNSLLQSSLESLRSNILRALPHELNTPLSGIVGIVDLLIDSYEGMDAESIKELLQYCRLSVHRMDHLIQRFLAYVGLQLIASNANNLAGLRAGQYQTAIAPILKQTLVMKAQEFNRPDAFDDSFEDAVVILNSQDLQLLFEELLDNAFKFLAPGAHVRIVGQALDENYLLSVSNQGRSITPDQISEIGLFMQFDRPRYEQQGVGLGFAIIQEILNIYDGTLSINSAPETETTTIHITLPLSSV